MKDAYIFTIGHSTHDLDYFRQLLSNNSINCIIDVRSVPFSAHCPHFNKIPLSKYLERNGVIYIHLPEAFGARRKDPTLLDEAGRVDFEKVRHTKVFNEGVFKIKQYTAKGRTISLMCSEANPLECHRFSMISYHLVRDGFIVRHILKNGGWLTHHDLEEKLVQKYLDRIKERSFFDSSSVVEVAYRLVNDEIGYRDDKYFRMGHR